MTWVAGLARWIVGHRRRVLVAWVLAVVAVSVVSGAIGSRYVNDNSIPGTQSQRAVDLLAREFPAQAGDSDQIVFRAREVTVTEPALRTRIDAMLDEVAGLPHVAEVVSPFADGNSAAISRDGVIAFATVQFDQLAQALPEEAVERVISTGAGVRSERLDVEFGGQAIVLTQQPPLGLASAVGLGAALLVLLVTFGSLLAAGVPIITALLGLGAGFGVVAIVSRALSMPDVSTELAAMIGLGVGIDYALFIVTRFRENYRAGVGLEAAIAGAMDTAGRAVVFAGVTVIVALLGMVVLGVTFLTGMAVGSAIVVLFTVVAAVTVAPALLSRFGPRIGRARRARATRRSLWRIWAGVVTRRPWPAAVAGGAVLLALAAPVLSMRLGVSDAGNGRSDQTTKKAYDLLATGFGAGFNGPLMVVADLRAGGDRTALDAVESALRRERGIASVSPVRTSPNGRAAVWQAFPRSSPQDPSTNSLVNRLRSDVLPPLERSTSTTLLVGGVTAGGIDFTEVLADNLPIFVAVITALAALLLLLVFRSLVIPAKATLLNLLSVAASLGVTVLIFQHGWLGDLVGVEPGPIDPWLPVMAFAIVLGLSMDYEVFLVSRIHEEWTRRRDASRAVVEGVASTGRVIAAAATIMICVFLSFALGPDRGVKLFGISLASAVFIDAFVIRSVLLPAVLQILGSRTWMLPTWLERRLPHLAIEPGSRPVIAEPGEPLEPALNEAG
jgi:RND superfamily putative drug exporter